MSITRLTILTGCLAAMFACTTSAETQPTHPAQARIVALLAARDAAVLSSDAAAFATTQVKGAAGSPQEACVAKEKVVTELVTLRDYNDWTDDRLVAFVRATNYKNDKAWTQSYFMHIFTKTRQGWLVEKTIFER